MGIKVNVTDENNVSVAVIPQARQVVNVNTPPSQTISINRGLIGPAGPQGPQGEPGVGIPTGGATGQILYKTSDANYATGWENLPNPQVNSDWTATSGVAEILHKPTLGTLSAQDSDNVSITGGSISGASISGYIPTSAEGVPNGVATLNSSGQVPLSQLPPLGDLSYQGAWNATTNTPTLTSSVGTKGYYYVVSVDGTTNLNGITDWKINDWAIFNGSVWQKIDNTDAVTSVNGQTGAVVLNYSDVGAFPATSTTGTGNVVLDNGASITAPTIVGIDDTGGGTIDNIPIGSITPSTGAFTDLNVGISGNDYVAIEGGTGGSPSVPPSITVNGPDSNIDLSIYAKGTGAINIPYANISGGNINNTIIGNYAPAAGTFTTLKANSTNLGLGFFAGQTSQGSFAVALGAGSGQSSQGANAVAIGSFAGTLSQGANSIAIGNSAGRGTTNNQEANTIILNATGTEIDGVLGQTNSTYIAPIRNASATSALGYNPTTYEVTYYTPTSGTVTSVAATVPSFLSVAGSPITTSGTLALTYSGTALPVANGGTGATTLTGYVKGNGTSAMTASATIPSGDVSGLGTMATQNANAVAITGGTLSNATLTSDTVSNNLAFTPTTAPSYVEGDVWYDSTAHALAYYNDSPAAVVHIGQDLQIKVINNTGSTIANGAPVYITSTSSGQTYPNIALAKADVAATSAVIGLTNGAIPNGSIGYVTGQGTIDGVNTGTFTVGQVLYLSPYSAGQLMNTIPPTGITVQVGVVSYVNSSTGKIYVKQTTPLAVPASIITGVLPVANGGTGVTTSTGSGSNVLNTSPTLTTPAITGGTIDNTVIGGTTPAAGTFTTITGQTEVLKGTGENLLLQSSSLTTTPFATANGTATGGQSDPLGGSTASLIIPNTTSTWSHYLSQTISSNATLTYTVSFYAKSSGYTGVQLGFTPGNSACFDLTGVSSPVFAAPFLSVTQTSVGSGWYRCSATVNGAGNLLGIFTVAINQSFNSSPSTYPAYAGNGTSGVYIAAPQLEIGSTANTYIPTTTTAVYGTPTLSFSGVAGLGLQSDGSLYVSPAGTGALQAQKTDSTATGGNARGANSVDWQTARSAASQVAGSQYAVLGGGSANTAGGFGAVINGGVSNNNTAAYGVIAGGQSNTQTSNYQGTYSVIAGGYGNTANGYYNFIGGGYTNSGTSASAVTTQSGTMNGTTAVTLSGSNASIKVGQYITGTSIASGTYVAAISGTSLTLSQAASGSSTSTLSFYTPHGVVVGGGNNQATGSYSFIGGGGDAGTAANRNVASGDWSFVGGGVKNTASGIYSSVAGGTNGVASGQGAFIGGGGWFGSGASTNTASGTSSFVGAGYGNSSTGFCSSVLGGSGNTANQNFNSVLGGANGSGRGIAGYTVFPANGNPLNSTQGAAQTAILSLARQTTDATATVLTSDTSAASGTNQVILPNNSAYYFKVRVIAGVTGAGNTKAWTLEGAIKRGANAASTAIVGTVTTTIVAADAGASTWTVTATADTSNGGLAITVTGQAATTIRWVAKAETAEMTY